MAPVTAGSAGEEREARDKPSGVGLAGSKGHSSFSPLVCPTPAAKTCKFPHDLLGSVKGQPDVTVTTAGKSPVST